MKKWIAGLIAVVLLVTALLPVTASAAEEPSGEYGTDYARYGDPTLDKEVDAKDALSALKNAVGKEEYTEFKTEVADTNDDGTVDAKDALDILKFAVSTITSFTAGEYHVVEQEQTPVEYIVEYNKSTVVNGSYTEDTTANTNFKLDQSGLQPNTVYRVTSPAVKNVDNARLIYSLQGLINRDFGTDAEHTSMIYVNKDGSDGDWYKYIKTDNDQSIFTNMEEIRITSWDEFMEHFGPTLKTAKMILWDGNVPATSNVAATICGIYGYLPVLAKSPLADELTEYGVKTQMDLTGYFTNGSTGKIRGTSIDSTGSAKNDAYLWALEKYFDKCSSQYLAYIVDGACTIKGYDAYTDNPTALLTDAGANCLPNMDYIIARRCFVYDLAVWNGEAACDDPAQKNGQAKAGLDNETMLKILQARFDRANGAFGQLLGFPPWWVKYTTHSNQGQKAATWIEWLYCEYITCYNMAKEADAQAPSSMTNGSFYYKYVPASSEYENNKTTKDISYDKNTFYYTIYVGDYDSSAWLKEHIHTMWMKGGGDKKRGKVDLMWSINPNLSYRVPMIFDYMYENLTDRDYMAGGDGGAGYIIPQALFTNKTLAYVGGTRPAANGNAGQAWADYSGAFYKRFDMDVTGFIINGASHTWDKDLASVFNKFSPVVNFHNCYKTPVSKLNGTYYVYCQNGIGPDTPSSELYSAMNNYWNGYNFGCYRTVTKTPKEIDKIVSNFSEYAETKGKKVQYCDPYTYAKLLKESGQGITL